VYDLSIISDKLLQIIGNALAASPLFGGGAPPFSVSVSGQHPQQPPTGADCDLNFYMFHLTEDKYLKNQFWSQASITGQPPGPTRQAVAFEPLCLDLYFLLSAQSTSSYVHEQQVMSVAMRALHEHGTVKLATPTPDGAAESEISLSLESPTWDELSRLWQSLSVPLRMTAQYRVGVAMLIPEKGLVVKPNPKTWALISAPATPGDPSLPQLLGTSRRVSYAAPATGARVFEQTPATAAPAPTAIAGQAFMLHGLGIKDTDLVYLVAYHADGSETEVDITPTWKHPLLPPYPTTPDGGVPFLLRAPQTPPGSCPAPGRYGLRVGRPTVPGWRSATVPFSIAPWIDPTGGPLLPAVAGVYTVPTANIPDFADKRVELRLGTTQLTRVAAGVPGPGEWVAGGGTLKFAAPGGMAAGTYPVGLRAADVEADPARWAVVA
jgi:hypothetical protein